MTRQAFACSLSVAPATSAPRALHSVPSGSAKSVRAAPCVPAAAAAAATVAAAAALTRGCTDLTLATRLPPTLETVTLSATSVVRLA